MVVDCPEATRTAALNAINAFNDLMKGNDVWLRLKLAPHELETIDKVDELVEGLISSEEDKVDKALDRITKIAREQKADVVVTCLDRDLSAAGGKDYRRLRGETFNVQDASDNKNTASLVTLPASPSTTRPGCPDGVSYGESPRRALAIHELLHAAGLDTQHSTDQNDVFYPDIRTGPSGGCDPITEVLNPEPKTATYDRLKADGLWPCTDESQRNVDEFDAKYPEGQTYAALPGDLIPGDLADAPTLSQWGIASMIGLLLVVGMMTTRGRRMI